MKFLMGNTLAWAFLAAALSTARADTPDPGYIDFGKLAPSKAGGEFVEVQISSNLINMAARLAEKLEPQITDALKGLRGVRVNVIGLNDDNRAEIEQRIQAIRDDLEARKWDRVVTAQQHDQDVRVYIKTRGAEAVEGLVVTVVDGNHQAVLVNVLGDIRPEKLALIGERFNIEPLKKLGQSLESK